MPLAPEWKDHNGRDSKIEKHSPRESKQLEQRVEKVITKIERTQLGLNEINLSGDGVNDPGENRIKAANAVGELEQLLRRRFELTIYFIERHLARDFKDDNGREKPRARKRRHVYSDTLRDPAIRLFEGGMELQESLRIEVKKIQMDTGMDVSIVIRTFDTDLPENPSRMNKEQRTILVSDLHNLFRYWEQLSAQTKYDSFHTPEKLCSEEVLSQLRQLMEQDETTVLWWMYCQMHKYLMNEYHYGVSPWALLYATNEIWKSNRREDGEDEKEDDEQHAIRGRLSSLLHLTIKRLGSHLGIPYPEKFLAQERRERELNLEEAEGLTRQYGAIGHIVMLLEAKLALLYLEPESKERNTKIEKLKKEQAIEARTAGRMMTDGYPIKSRKIIDLLDEAPETLEADLLKEAEAKGKDTVVNELIAKLLRMAPPYDQKLKPSDTWKLAQKIKPEIAQIPEELILVKETTESSTWEDQIRSLLLETLDSLQGLAMDPFVKVYRKVKPDNHRYTAFYKAWCAWERKMGEDETEAEVNARKGSAISEMERICCESPTEGVRYVYDYIAESAEWDGPNGNGKRRETVPLVYLLGMLAFTIPGAEFSNALIGKLIRDSNEETLDTRRKAIEEVKNLLCNLHNK